MAEAKLPDEVERFIAHHIQSVEQLEVLLLLRSHKDRTWSGPAVAQELRIDPESASTRLKDLAGRGLLEPVPGDPDEFRYKPRTTDLDLAVAGLADAYKQRRYTVINRIFSKPLDHIRTFSDAFKLRKDD